MSRRAGHVRTESPVNFSSVSTLSAWWLPVVSVSSIQAQAVGTLADDEHHAVQRQESLAVDDSDRQTLPACRTLAIVIRVAEQQNAAAFFRRPECRRIR